MYFSDNLLVHSHAYYLPFLVTLVCPILNRHDIPLITYYLFFLCCVNLACFQMIFLCYSFIFSCLYQYRLLFFYYFFLLFLSKPCSVSAHPFSNSLQPSFLWRHGLGKKSPPPKNVSSNYLFCLNFETQKNYRYNMVFDLKMQHLCRGISQLIEGEDRRISHMAMGRICEWV